MFAEQDIKVLFLSAYRCMDAKAKQTLLRAACQFRPLNTHLKRIRVTPVPPMLNQAIERPEGWLLVDLIAEMVNEDLRRATEGGLNADDISLVGLVDAARMVADRWQHDDVAKLWLVSLLRSCAGWQATVFVDGLLRGGTYELPAAKHIESPWQVADGPWVEQLADGSAFDHPAASLPADQIADLLLDDLTDEHDTVLWLTGVAGVNEPAASELEADDERESSGPPETDGSDVLDDTDDTDVADVADETDEWIDTDAPGNADREELEAAYLAGRDAAERIAEALAEARTGAREDLATLVRLHQLADRAAQVTGLASEDVQALLAELDDLAGPDPDDELLARLAALQTDASADAQGASVRARARAVLQGDDDSCRAGLLALGRLLDGDELPAPSALFPLLELLPVELHAAALAAGSGLLQLPDMGAPEMPVGDEVVSDARTDGESGEEPVADEPSSEQTPDAGTDAAADETSSGERDVPGDEEPAGEVAADTGATDPATSAEVADAGSRTADPEPGEDADDPDEVDTEERSATVSEVAEASDTTGEDLGQDPVLLPNDPRAYLDAPPAQLDPPPVTVDVTTAAVDANESNDEPGEDLDRDIGPSEEQVDGLLVAALERRDAAAAYWIASSFDIDPARSASFEMLALARQMRREGGPVGLSFDKAATRLPAEILLEDRTARIIAVAAGLTASFVAPYTAAEFLSIISGTFEHHDRLHQILQSATAAARAGVRIGVGPPTGDADDDDELDEIRQHAATLLEVGPGRSTGYQPATRIWQRWIDADRGWLGRMLTVVANDDRSQLEQVRAERQKVASDRDLVERMNATDGDERARNPRPIEYHGRSALLRRVSSHLELVDDWLEFAGQRREAANDHNTWEERTSVELRQMLTAYGQDALEELSQVGDDQLAQAAAAFACEQLRSLFEAMTSGRPLPGREPDPDAWLARPLLHTDVPLDPDSWQPTRPLTFEDLRPLVDPVDALAAFHRRLGRNDFEEAAAIAAQIASSDPAQSDALSDHLDRAAESAQQTAAQRWLEVRDLVTAAKRQGMLRSDEAVELDQRFAELDLTGAGELATSASSRTDVGKVLRQIDQIERDLRQARRVRIGRELALLEQALETSPELADHADMLRTHIEAGRLAEAEELRLQLEEGRELSNPSDPDWYRPQLLATLTTPTGLSDELVEAVTSGGRWGPFSYDQLRESDRARSATVLQRARGLLGLDRRESPQAVRTVLTRLGLDVAADAVAVAGHPGGRHRWFDAKVVARGAPVRQFGSSLDSRLKILVTPSSMAPSQIVELVEDEAGGSTTLLLHTAPVDLRWRQELADALRGSSATPVLAYDSHLLAARMCEPSDSWAVTCALALPYANANPYLFNVQGETLPTEAFFGRRSELRSLLDPHGATIVFGGRQLGKTALLKQASVAFTGYDEHSRVAFKSIKSVGIDGDPSALWPVLHMMLVDAGVPLPTPSPGSDRETVVREVHRWLDADDRRRLLVLLDEADLLLAADAPHYTTVEALKDMVAASPRRFKVVFSGLRDVTRFQRDANHPFVHLGKPLGIGGLDPDDALSLLRVPLRALGFHADEDVLLSAATFANYHPAILQRVSHELVRQLQERVRDSAPGWQVTSADVDKVFDDSQVSEYVTQLLLDTLTLDARYGVLAYAMALADRSEGAESPVPRTAAQVQKVCLEEGAEELASGDREGEVAALLDELDLLGIARKRPGGRWELRSRYIARMLGDDLQLVNRLLEFSARSGGYTYDASRHRRPFESDPTKVSPLADRDIVSLTTWPSTVKIVIGSDATTLDEVGAIMAEDAATRGTSTSVHLRCELGQRSGDKRRPPHANKDFHRVVVSDLRDRTERQCERAVAQASAWRDDSLLPGSVGVALLVDASQLATVRATIDGTLSEDVDVVPLRRLDTHAIGQWARIGELPLGDADQVRAATGGWPQLLTEAARNAREGGGTVADAAAGVHAALDDADRAARFLADTRADHLDTTARTAFTVLRDYGPVTVEEFDRELATILAGGRPLESTLPTARRERLLLERLGYVESAEGRVCAEPILAAAWAKVHG